MTLCRNHKDCIKTAMQTAERLCETQKLRFTDLRRQVLKIIWSRHRPIKAYEVLAQLDANQTCVAPPTVYRSLTFLLQNGLVHKLSKQRAYVGCAHPNRHYQCCFIICSSCGTCEECCGFALAQAVVGIAEQHKFQLNTAAVEIEGRCRICQL